MRDMASLIKARMALADENATNFVYFTPQQRKEIVQWLESKQSEIVRCKDCRFAHMTYDGLCKQCDNATDDDDFMLTLYLPGDFYCAFGERKEGDGE